MVDEHVNDDDFEDYDSEWGDSIGALDALRLANFGPPDPEVEAYCEFVRKYGLYWGEIGF